MATTSSSADSEDLQTVAAAWAKAARYSANPLAREVRRVGGQIEGLSVPRVHPLPSRRAVYATADWNIQLSSRGELPLRTPLGWQSPD